MRKIALKVFFVHHVTIETLKVVLNMENVLNYIKMEVSQSIIDNGGAITHHYAFGKYHLPYLVQRRSAMFGSMLKAGKESVDREWIMNPGVLLAEKNE